MISRLANILHVIVNSNLSNGRRLYFCSICTEQLCPCVWRNTSALLQQELDAPLVLLLLLREPPVPVQLRAVQGVLQPLHQPLLLVQLHLQLGQGQLQLPLLLAQRHHLRPQPNIDVTCGVCRIVTKHYLQN